MYYFTQFSILGHAEQLYVNFNDTIRIGFYRGFSKGYENVSSQKRFGKFLVAVYMSKKVERRPSSKYQIDAHKHECGMNLSTTLSRTVQMHFTRLELLHVGCSQRSCCSGQVFEAW